MRDAYGTAVELPHMAKWAAGEPDDLEWLQGWCATLREHVQSWQVRPPGTNRVRAAERLSALVLQHRVSDGGGRGGYPLGAPQAGVVGRAARKRLLPVR